MINLVDQCWKAVVRLLQAGVMCRGYISQGSIYHTDTQVVGTGYQEAYEKESQVAAFKREADERGTPFVEVAPAVAAYVSDCGDPCVQEMFSRLVRDDGETVAVFPFQRFSHSFIIGGLGHKFDPEKERRSNDNMGASIKQLMARIQALVDTSNPQAVRKSEHYLSALEAQLQICDQTDRMIDQLSAPFPRRWT